MKVSVRIYAYLRQYLSPAEKRNLMKEWELPERATVQLVLERLKLPDGVRVTVLVNDNSVDRMTGLKDGDILHILPQMGGG